MLLTFCACGMSKEEMLEDAKTVYWEDFENTYTLYNDKIVYIPNFPVAYIYNNETLFGEPHITSGCFSIVSVYLPAEEIVNISAGDTVSIVGVVKTGEFIDGDTERQIQNAHVVD